MSSRTSMYAPVLLPFKLLYLNCSPSFSNEEITAHLEQFARGEKVSSRTSMYAPVLLPFKLLYLNCFPSFSNGEITAHLEQFAQVKIRIIAHLEPLSAISENSCTTMYTKIFLFF